MSAAKECYTINLVTPVHEAVDAPMPSGRPPSRLLVFLRRLIPTVAGFPVTDRAGSVVALLAPARQTLLKDPSGRVLASIDLNVVDLMAGSSRATLRDARRLVIAEIEPDRRGQHLVRLMSGRQFLFANGTAPDNWTLHDESGALVAGGWAVRVKDGYSLGSVTIEEHEAVFPPYLLAGLCWIRAVFVLPHRPNL